MTMMRHDPIDPGELGGIEQPVFPAPPVFAARPVRVADCMTRPAVTIGWEQPVAHASRLMVEHHFRHLPVIDADGRLVGIVTDGDLAEALAAERVWDAAAAPPTLIVGKVMTWDAVAVSTSCELAEAVKLMHERRLSALPVVEGGEVAGILCESDVLREFVRTVARG